ncbi:MAG: hypothetical protein AAF652_17595 [Cyanobacteria bacterium P01_C01_bin.72]
MLKTIMLKNILRLFAASASFVALLLITSPAIATPAVANLDTQLGMPHLNLSVISPSLRENSNILLEHFGCTCAICTQSQAQTAHQI